MDYIFYKKMSIEERVDKYIYFQVQFYDSFVSHFYNNFLKNKKATYLDIKDFLEICRLSQIVQMQSIEAFYEKAKEIIKDNARYIKHEDDVLDVIPNFAVYHIYLMFEYMISLFKDRKVKSDLLIDNFYIEQDKPYRYKWGVFDYYIKNIVNLPAVEYNIYKENQYANTRRSFFFLKKIVFESLQSEYMYLFNKISFALFSFYNIFMLDKVKYKEIKINEDLAKEITDFFTINIKSSREEYKKIMKIVKDNLNNVIQNNIVNEFIHSFVDTINK